MSSNTELLTRGVEQVLPDLASLERRLAEGPLKVYLGIDPTGNQLTLGHYVVLRKLQQFTAAGHHVILLIGNGTVRIGDPTGRDSTRPELTDEQIAANFVTWKAQAERVLDFTKIEIKHNGEWLDHLQLPDLVKLLAKTTVQQLIERDMFQARLKQNLPIYGHEIIYPLLQGYDSVAMDIDLEIGGSDQLFNMMMGRTLQKAYRNREKWVLTTPIINGSDGRKMSKSYGNFIGLTENPVDMYGKLMRVADSEITNYFRILTDVPLPEIDEMEQKMQAGDNPMTFKKKLAETITSQLHSPEAAAQAQEVFAATVQRQTNTDQLPQLSWNEQRPPQLIELVRLAQPELSGSQVRRLLEQGAIELDGVRQGDPNSLVTADSPLLRVGKHVLVRIHTKGQI